MAKIMTKPPSSAYDDFYDRVFNQKTEKDMGTERWGKALFGPGFYITKSSDGKRTFNEQGKVV